MRIIDWSSDVCSSDLSQGSSRRIAASMDCPVDPLKIMHGSRRNPSDRWLPSGDFYRYARATALRKPLRPKDGAGAAKHRLRAKPPRSEERRVGNECVSTGNSRGSQYNLKKNQDIPKKNK